MRHNKLRNVGLLMEVMSSGVSDAVSHNDLRHGEKIYGLIKEHFLNADSYIGHIYKEIYSPILYGETNNYFYASRYMQYIMEEYVNIDHNKLNKEINALIESMDNSIDRKSLFNRKIKNYKLFASVKCLGDHMNGTLPISPTQRAMCEETVMNHLVENSEVKRLKESNDEFTFDDEERLNEEKVAIAIALRKFKEKYNNMLTNEQNEFLMKYLTSESDKSFTRWCEKKMKNLVKEIDNNLDKVTDDQLVEKLTLAKDKYQKIISEGRITAENMINVLLSFDLKDCLDLYGDK